MILKEITHYRDSNISEILIIQIQDKMSMIKKFEKAITNLLVAFDIEEITKELSIRYGTREL